MASRRSNSDFPFALFVLAAVFLMGSCQPFSDLVYSISGTDAPGTVSDASETIDTPGSDGLGETITDTIEGIGNNLGDQISDGIEATQPANDPATQTPDASQPAPSVDPEPNGQLDQYEAALDETLTGLAVINQPEDRQAAIDLINQLPLAEPFYYEQYDRDAFGQSWTDDNDAWLGNNGCDTRNDILNRDLDNVVYREGTRDCVVINGTFTSPYTLAPVVFEKAKANEVHIDHVISLSAGWQMGASVWDEEKRKAFANDPLNLLASIGSVNSSKSDETPSEWLPPAAEARCGFSVRYAAVTLRYELAVTPADHAAMLAACA